MRLENRQAAQGSAKDTYHAHNYIRLPGSNSYADDLLSKCPTLLLDCGLCGASSESIFDHVIKYFLKLLIVCFYNSIYAQ